MCYHSDEVKGFLFERVSTMSSSMSSSSLSGKRVLLCDDHKLNAAITAKMLERVGVVVVRADNGRTGYQLFLEEESGFFDAVLMDLNMPIMNGQEAAKAIRASSKDDAASIPIIAVSAQDCTTMNSSGEINAWLVKPVEPEALYAALHRFIIESE